jgi:hypothetical protein
MNSPPESLETYIISKMKMLHQHQKTSHIYNLSKHLTHEKNENDVLLIATAALKLMESNNTQLFKFYLLLATLLFLTSKIYNAIKYYDGVRTRAAREDTTP